MQQKNVVILLWTYTRDPRLTAEPACRALVEKCLDAMLQYQTQFFKVDNFDLLLLVQTARHVQKDPHLKDNADVVSKLMQQMRQLDAHCLQSIDLMSVHEFVTVSTFYLSLLSEGVCSKSLAEALLGKIGESLGEFNELQLVLFKSTIESAFVKERQLYSSDEAARAHMFHGDAAIVAALEECYRGLQVELQQLREAKELSLVEEHVRGQVREKLSLMDEGEVGQEWRRKAKIYHEQGDEEVRGRLSMEMHRSGASRAEESREEAEEPSKGDSEQVEADQNSGVDSEAETEAMKKLKKYLLNQGKSNRQ